MSTSYSPKQSHDVALISGYFIRIYFEKPNNKNVPMGIKNIISIYSNKFIIGTKLLSFHQDLDFFKLLKKCIKGIKGVTLLYRASENEFSAKVFKEKCIGMHKSGQIVIIKSNNNTIFGGYISKDWSKQSDDLTGEEYTEDGSAFIYLIKHDDDEVTAKCPLHFAIKSNYKQYAISHKVIFGDCICGPNFGLHDIYISDKCNKMELFWDTDEQKDVYSSVNYTCFSAYDNNGFDDDFILCGGDKNSVGYGNFDVVDYEVYKVWTN